MVAEQKVVLEELGWLLDVLPRRVSDTLRQREDLDELLEVVLDLGRVPEARFPSNDFPLDDQEVTQSHRLRRWISRASCHRSTGRMPFPSSFWSILSRPRECGRPSASS